MRRPVIVVKTQSTCFVCPITINLTFSYENLLNHGFAFNKQNESRHEVCDAEIVKYIYYLYF